MEKRMTFPLPDAVLSRMSAPIIRCFPGPHRAFSTLLLAFGAGIALPSCGGSTKGDKVARSGGAPVPVLVGQAVVKDMPVTINAIGRVHAEASVSLKSQVTGRITKIHFQEGQEVQEGDVLITIDPAPFEVALAQARAALAQATAVATNANAQVRRYTSLDKGGGVSKEQIDQVLVEAKKAAAEVASAEAAVQKAELELGYCTLRAPLTGRTGRFLVTEGNVVTANQTDLTVINQISPIDVLFTLPERHLPVLRQGLNSGELKTFALTSAATLAAARQQQNDVEGTAGLPHVEGTLRFLDNSVNTSTSTIDLKASFPNDPPTLWPGQFVNLTLQVSVERQALVIPSTAVQAGQNGPFVFVLTETQTAEAQPITLSRTVGQEAVVARGLKAGDTVVTDGHSRLAQGSKVSIKKSLEEAVEGAIGAANPSSR